MKKAIIVTLFLLVIALLIYFIHFAWEPTEQPTPTPTNAPVASSVPTATPEPTVSATPEPERTPDPRNEEDAVRAEIANLIRDAKELLDEGLTDDAEMVLRDLRTRDLTPAEEEQVAALQASMILRDRQQSGALKE